MTSLELHLRFGVWFMLADLGSLESDQLIYRKKLGHSVWCNGL